MRVQIDFNDDELTSGDIERVYKGVYQVAKKLGDPIWTDAVYRQLHLQFTNPGLTREGFNKRQKLSGLSYKIDSHYEKLFRELKNRQFENAVD